MIHSPTCFGHNNLVFLPQKIKQKTKKILLLRVRNDKHPFEACATGNVASYFFPFSLRVGNDKYLFEACATGCYPLRRHATGKLVFHFVEYNNTVNANQVYWVGFWWAYLLRWWYTFTPSTRMDSLFRCIVGWKTGVWMSLMGIKYLEMYIMLVYRLILELQG